MRRPARFKSLLAILVAALLSGCANTSLRDASGDTSLADRFTGLLDQRCPIPAEPKLETADQR